MKVSKDSWHYRAYSILGNDWTDLNICIYVRKIILGIGLCTFFTCIMIGIFLLLVAPIFVGVMTLITGVFIDAGWFWQGVTLYIIMVMVSIYYGIKWLWDKREPRPDSETKILVKTWYRSIKENTCIKLEVK